MIEWEDDYGICWNAKFDEVSLHISKYNVSSYRYEAIADGYYEHGITDSLSEARVKAIEIAKPFIVKRINELQNLLNEV